MPPLAQAIAVEPPEALRIAAAGELPDLSKESFSVAEAARLLKITEGHTRYLGRLGVLPMDQVEGELRVERDALVTYQREQEAEIERFIHSPFGQAMGAISAELIEKGLYRKATPEALTQQTK
ncbi:hypothetical protein AXK11_04615 [Cephaloticoccus primus]|uniref:Helix-turn-helix domain-containing protein n=1 Tax=Cephaloticoccus primus TaxID=1548207 RepID=A0A139SP38_9BACT|nr:helix-turn-helix domain-containing protein [Cephaloticoccus primus]KXU36274.1 hypothetical protein AXK11_04615 [Cephaloticoccus primus]